MDRFSRLVLVSTLNAQAEHQAEEISDADAAADRMTCYRCRQAKAASAFTQRVDDRQYRMCRACVSEILRTRGTGEKRARLTHTATHRTCYLCRRVLAVAEFTRRSNGTYFSACKACNRHVFAARRRARIEGAGGT